MDVRIRWRGEADKPALREINRSSFEHAYSRIFEPRELEGLFSDRLQQSSTWTGARRGLFGVLVAEIDPGNAGRKLVGFASLARWGDNDGELAAFYVLPDYQGRGVGMALWGAATGALKDAGFRGMQVWCMARAEVAGFYERRGCREIGGGTYRVGEHAERTIGYRIEL